MQYTTCATARPLGLAWSNTLAQGRTCRALAHPLCQAPVWVRSVPGLSTDPAGKGRAQTWARTAWLSIQGPQRSSFLMCQTAYGKTEAQAETAADSGRMALGTRSLVHFLLFKLCAAPMQCPSGPFRVQTPPPSLIHSSSHLCRRRER